MRLHNHHCQDQGMSDTQTLDVVFLGHMLAIKHGVIWTTQVEVEKDKAIAAQIFGCQPKDTFICECQGEDWCLWVLAIQVLICLIPTPLRPAFELWHVYSAENKPL